MAERKTTKKQEKTVSFEEAMERINEITEALSSGDSGLDESLELFTEATELIAFCKSKLDQAELKITNLSDQTADK